MFLFCILLAGAIIWEFLEVARRRRRLKDGEKTNGRRKL
jgi:hypothetical protein